LQIPGVPDAGESRISGVPDTRESRIPGVVVSGESVFFTTFKLQDNLPSSGTPGLCKPPVSRTLWIHKSPVSQTPGSQESLVSMTLGSQESPVSPDNGELFFDCSLFFKLPAIATAFKEIIYQKSLCIFYLIYKYFLVHVFKIFLTSLLLDVTPGVLDTGESF